jgi:nucleoporin NUP82
MQTALRKTRKPDVASILQSSSTSDANATVPSQSSVAALLVINEVYLGYALLLLTATGSVVTLEMSSPVSLSSKAGNHLALSANKAGSGTDALQLTGQGDRQSYVAFPDNAQFDLPQLLIKKGSTPSTRFASPPATGRTERVSSGGEIELTVDSLRFVGQTVEKLDAQIKTLIQSGNLVQERLELQLKELPRQAGKCHEVEDALQEKASILKNDYSPRLDKIKETQRGLEKRADKLLQRLIDNSQPELSSFEKRWMEELERIQNAVGVAAGSKQERPIGMQARLQRLQEQLEVLKPQLEHMSKTSFSSKEEQRLGSAQRRQIEAALSEE